MQRAMLLPLAAVLLAACQDAPTSPPAPEGLRPSFAAALAITTSERIPIELVVDVPCANGGAGEIVELGGYLHILDHVTFTDNGLHVKSHFQPQGISGVGLTTGASYQATGVTQEEFNIPLNTLGFTDSYVNNYRIIGQGPGNNFLIHETVHVTVNALGEVTSEVGNFRVECK